MSNKSNNISLDVFAQVPQIKVKFLNVPTKSSQKLTVMLLKTLTLNFVSQARLVSTSRFSYHIDVNVRKEISLKVMVCLR